MSTVTIELPEPIRESLEAQGWGLERRALELLAVDGYRQEALSRGQVSQMLGLNYWETEKFLKEHKAYLHYDIHDFEQDIETLARLEQKHL